MIMVYGSQYTKDHCTAPAHVPAPATNATVAKVCRRLVQATAERRFEIRWVKVKGHSGVVTRATMQQSSSVSSPILCIRFELSRFDRLVTTAPQCAQQTTPTSLTRAASDRSLWCCLLCWILEYILFVTGNRTSNRLWLWLYLWLLLLLLRLTGTNLTV